MTKSLHVIFVSLLFIFFTACGSDISNKNSAIYSETNSLERGNGLEAGTANLTYYPTRGNAGYAGNYGYGYNSGPLMIWVNYEREYLQALKRQADAAVITAQADLERAKAKRAQDDIKTLAIAEKLKEIIAYKNSMDLIFESYDIQKHELANIDSKINAFALGETQVDNMNALEFLIQAAGLGGELVKIKVESFGKDQFEIPRGRTMALIKNCDGKSVYGKIEPVAFPKRCDLGGSSLEDLTARDFLDFLRAQRQDVKGAAAKAVLTKIAELVKGKAAAWSSQIDADKAAVAAGVKAKWSEMEELIKAIKEGKYENQDDDA